MKTFSFWPLCLIMLLGPSSVQSDEPMDRTAAIPLAPELRDRCLDVLRRGLAGMADTPDSFWPAMHAAEGLTLAGRGPEVVTLLRERLPKEQDHQRRCGLARELVRAGRREPLGVLFETLGDESSNGRVHAAESLYKVAEIGDGTLMRAAYQQTADTRLRLMAAAALARTGDTAALKAHRDALGSDDFEIRKIGAWVLGLLGDASDVAPLKKLTATETNELAKAYLINALACLGDDDACRELGMNLSSANAAVRTYSAEFAGYSRSVELRARLIALLADENVDVRVRSAQTLIAFSQPHVARSLRVEQPAR